MFESRPGTQSNTFVKLPLGIVLVENNIAGFMPCVSRRLSGQHRSKHTIPVSRLADYLHLMQIFRHVF
jgi:hypothetical protein